MRGAQRVVAGFVFALAAGCGTTDEKPGSSKQEGLSYYGDVLPIFEQHCLECHQEGGIAPFPLDDYAEAKRRAASIEHETAERVMPPWSATSDGSCQEFSHSLSLSDTEIGTIHDWVEGGAREGTPRAVALPERPGLGDAVELETPAFSPVAQGGDLAEFDEYRCFLMDRTFDTTEFITGYEVLPGTPDVVHHVLAMLVDVDAQSDAPGKTNGEVMAALDAESPDRDGWPCFGMAGDQVEVESVPVVWAPGQGVVEYPGESGVPVLPGHRVVVQVHYNLANDPGAVTDRSVVRLRLADSVTNVGVFTLDDPFLDTLYDDTPATLAPGQPSVEYKWKRDVSDYFGDTPDVKLWGVMPHMHQRGKSYRMDLGTPGNMGCGVNVPAWDFHWQRMYFYAHPIAMTKSSRFEVTCDFDTSADTSPVLPGWGTRNEMCLATLYFTVPAALYGL
jgi:mono/diheme cytochrome c family protein